MSHVWLIRIKNKKDSEKKWEEIEPQPTAPYYSLEEVTLICHGLLFEHPSVIAIQIQDRDNFNETHVFEQKE